MCVKSLKEILLLLPMVQAIFDIRGVIPKYILSRVRAKSLVRVKSVEEAFMQDMQAIGGDMRRAIDNY